MNEYFYDPFFIGPCEVERALDLGVIDFADRTTKDILVTQMFTYWENTYGIMEYIFKFTTLNPQIPGWKDRAYRFRK